MRQSPDNHSGIIIYNAAGGYNITVLNALLPVIF
jgi:hypothetical protein